MRNNNIHNSCVHDLDITETKTEELRPAQDDFSFLKCCNERSKAFLDKLSLRPVERFLKEVAQGLGATVLESNHNVINCIPLNETDLEQNIHHLEQLLHEARTYSSEKFDKHTNTELHGGHMIREHLEVSPKDIHEQKNETINCDKTFVFKTKEGYLMNNSNQQVVNYNSEVTSKEVKSSVENQEVQNESVDALEVELEKSDEIQKNNSVQLPYSQTKSKQVFDKPDSEKLSLDKNKEDLNKKKHLRFSKMNSEVDFSGYVHHNLNHKHRRKHEKSNVHKIERKQKTLNSNYLLTGQHDKNYVVDSLYREQLGMKPYGTDFSHIDIDNMLIDNQEHGIISPNLTIKRKYSDRVCHDVEKIENEMRFEDNLHDENLIMPNIDCSNVSSNEMVRDHGDSDYNDTRSQIMAKTPLNAMEPLLYKTNIDQYGLYDIIPMKQKIKHIKQHKVPRQDPLLYNPVASHHAVSPLHRKRNKKQDYMEYDYIHELPCDYTKCTIPNDIDINNYSDELKEMDHCSGINASSLENIVKTDTKCKPLRPHRIKRKVNNNINLKDRSISDFYEELYEDDVNNKVMKNVIRSYALNRSIKKSSTKDTGVCVSGSSIANHYKTISIKRNQEVQMDEKQFVQNKMFSVGTECAFPILNEQKLERDLISNDRSMGNPREQILEIKHLLTSCLKELMTDTKHNETSRTDMYKCCSSSKCCCTLEDSFSHTYIELPSVTCKQCNKRGDCTFQNSESCQNCQHTYGNSPASIFNDYLISNPPVNKKSWKGYDCDTRHYTTRSTQLSESCKSICITNSVNNTSVKVYDDPRSAIHKEITIDGHTYILLDNANKLYKHNVKNDMKDDSSERMSRQCCGYYSKKKRTSNTYPNNYIEIEKDKNLQTKLKSTETISTAKCSIKDQLEKKVSTISINNDAHDINAMCPADMVELQPEPCQSPVIENSIPDTSSPAHVEKPTTESSPISSPESPLKRLKLKPFIKKKQLEHKVAALPRDELKVKPINNIYNCIKEYLKKRYKLTTQKYVELQREHISDHCNEQKNNLLGDMGELDLIKMRLNQRSNVMTPNINSNKVSIFDTFRFDNYYVSCKPEFPNSCFDNNCNAKNCIDTLETNNVLNLQSQRKPTPLLHGLMNAQRTIPNDYSYRRQMPVPIYSSSAINISSNNCHGGQSRIFLLAQKSELVLDSNLMLKKPEINKESDDDVSRTSERQTSVFAKIIKTFRKPRYRERREKVLDTAYRNDNFGSTLSGNPSSRMYAYVKTPVCVMPLQRWNSYPNHTMESKHEKRCVSHESTFRTDKKKKHTQKPPLKWNFFDFKGKNIKDDTACSSDTSDDSECDLELAKKVISRQMRNRKYYSDNEVGKMKRSSVHISKKRSKSNSTKKNKYKEIGVQAKVKYPQINKKKTPGAKMDKTGDTLRESIEKFWLSTLQSDKKQKKPFSRRKKYKSPFANPLYAMMRTMQGREAKFSIPKTRVKPII